MSDWTMLTKQQLENDAEDRAGDSSAMDHILTGLALYARIAELEAALLAFHDSPAGDMNELSMRLEQAEAALAERDDDLEWLIDTLDFNLQESGFAQKALDKRHDDLRVGAEEGSD